jgi:hypothetical protein
MFEAKLFVYLHGHAAHTLTHKRKGLGARQSSGWRSIGVGGIREQKLLEGFGKRPDDISG